ncbi:MAG: hypothetical protein AAB403_13665 [Planctomycetota bacterium]
MDGVVGAVESGLQWAAGSVVGVRPVLPEAVGQGSAKPLVEEQEQKRDLHALGGKPIGVAGTVPL